MKLKKIIREGAKYIASPYVYLADKGLKAYKNYVNPNPQGLDEYQSTMENIIDQQLALADEQDKLYQDTYAPLENQVVADAKQAGTADFAGVTQRASDNVGTGISVADGIKNRDMARYGINPNSDQATESARISGIRDQALRAGAMTRAARAERARADDSGWSQQVQALSLGHGLPTEAGGSLSMAGNSATTVANLNNQGVANNIDTGNALGHAVGYPAGRYAGGGIVRGPGTETSDSIPAKLSDGEFVMSAAAVRHFGLSKFEKMNEAGIKAEHTRAPHTNHFANGGLATGVIYGAMQGLRQGEQDKRAADQDARQQEEFDMHKTAMKAQLADLAKSEDYKQLVRDHRQALGGFLSTGDPTPIQDWTNKYFPDAQASIQREPDGSYLATGPKGERKFANADELAMQTLTLVDPMVYYKRKLDAQKQKEQYITDNNGNINYLVGAKSTPVLDAKGRAVRAKPHGDSGKGGSTEALIDRISSEFKVPWDTAFEIYKNSANNPTETLRKNYMSLVDSDQKNLVDRSDDDRWAQAKEMTKRMMGEYTGGLSTRYRPGTGKDTKSLPAPPKASGDVRSSILGAPVDVSGGAGPIQGLMPPPSDAQTASPGTDAQASAPRDYVAPNGRKVTWPEIEQTARNRGINPDDVISALKLK